MLLRLASPVLRPGSSIPQFVQRIPADLKGSTVGLRLEIPVGDDFVTVAITEKTQAIRFSLGTRDPAEAKGRQAGALSFIARVFDQLRADEPVTLTHRQATALGGEFYRSWTDELHRERKHSIIHTDAGWVADDDDDDGSDDELIFASVVAYFDRIKESSDENALEITFGPIVDRLLARKGIIRVKPASRRMVLEAFWLAGRDAMERRQREAGGDYSPDPKAERFPEWSQPQPASKPALITATPSVTLTSLLEDWWRESQAAGMKPRTYQSYGNTIANLKRFLKHDDAMRVTPDDVVRFKDWRLTTPNEKTGTPASARTVKDTDLAALKSIFGWAVRNRKLPSNPAEGITIRLGKQKKVRQTGFTADEVKALLQSCLTLERGTDRRETYGAKRWVPWLLAYTGARVGEIAQLRKQDVEQTGDHWSIKITPEAGTVKGNEPRLVPLHPHLIDQGFIEFVDGADNGHLFLRPNKDTKDVLGPLTGVKNRVREFVRLTVSDPNVQPNHAWRHLFITRCRAAGVDHELRRMITGHSGEGVDEKVYGDPAGLYREICKLPRFEVG